MQAAIETGSAERKPFYDCSEVRLSSDVTLTFISYAKLETIFIWIIRPEIEARCMWTLCGKYDAFICKLKSCYDKDKNSTLLAFDCALCVCRNVTGSDNLIDAAMKSLRDVGFINYYGMQRFGTTCVTTHEIGRSVTLFSHSLIYLTGQRVIS